MDTLGKKTPAQLKTVKNNDETIVSCCLGSRALLMLMLSVTSGLLLLSQVRVSGKV